MSDHEPFEVPHRNVYVWNVMTKGTTKTVDERTFYTQKFTDKDVDSLAEDDDHLRLRAQMIAKHLRNVHRENPNMIFALQECTDEHIEEIRFEFNGNREKGNQDPFKLYLNRADGHIRCTIVPKGRKVTFDNDLMRDLTYDGKHVRSYRHQHVILDSTFVLVNLHVAPNPPFDNHTEREVEILDKFNTVAQKVVSKYELLVVGDFNTKFTTHSENFMKGGRSNSDNDTIYVDHAINQTYQNYKKMTPANPSPSPDAAGIAKQRLLVTQTTCLCPHTVQRNQTVTVSDSRDGYTFVQTEDGREGWIDSSLIESLLDA